MDSLTYLQPGQLRFTLSDTGILSLDYDGQQYSPITLIRLFPFRDPFQYLSIFSNETEIGILEDLKQLEDSQQTLLTEYLTYKYFIPKITHISKLEEKLGYVYMDIRTVMGGKTICIADVTTNIREVRTDFISIIDVQGNRYYLEGLDGLDRDTRQKIELYI